MQRVTPHVEGEYYHIYSRGVDRRSIFDSESDYERFVSLLHIGKSGKPFQMRDLSLEEIFKIDIDKPIIEIIEWCLMPNHFHLVVKELEKGGIEKYMRKVLTGYSMYFNLKNNRSGPLFSGRFKSKHIANDLYLKKVREYVKLNPLEMYFKNWQETLDEDDAQINQKQIDQLATKHLKNFRYSSYNKFYILSN